MVLVAANDHLLKGSGLLPGWLTGKLSDFAGLYFAPLLLAELVCVLWPTPPAQAARRLAVIAVGIAVAFAALKLSPAAAALYDGVSAGLFGFHARTTTDRWDLIAAPMVVLAFLDGRRAACTSRTDCA